MPPRPQSRPAAPAYNYERDLESNRGNFNNRILKPGIVASVKKPSWKKTETVFRPYPSLSYETDDQLLPCFIDPGGKNHLGEWLRRYDCAWGVGNPATTFLIRDPQSTDSTYDPWMTPLGVLYRAIEGVCKKGHGRPSWYALREGGSGRGKALKGPNELFLMQGVLMRIDNKDQFGPGKIPPGWGNNPPCILMLSGGIGKELIRQVYSENEDYRGDPADFEARYVHGDPVSPQTGRYFHIFEKGSDPRSRYQNNPSTPPPSPFSVAGGGVGPGHAAGEGEDFGFDMFISKDLNGLPAMFTPEAVEVVKKKWMYWENILWFPTEVEQAHMLFKIFPADACLYAFEGHNQEWIPEDGRRMATVAVSASVPGAPPGMAPGGVIPGFSPFGPPMHAAPVQPMPPQVPQQMPAMPAQMQQPWGGHSQPMSPAYPQQPAPVAQHPQMAPPVQTPFGGMDSAFGGQATDESVPNGQIDDGGGVESAGFGFDPQPEFPAQPQATAASPQQQARGADSVAKLMAARQAAARGK